MSRSLCALNLLLLCLIGVVGCGTSQAPMPSASEKYDVAMEAPAEDVGAALAMFQQPTESGEAAGSALIERKIIYNATVELTVEDFADIPAKVEQLAEEYDGFIAHASLQTAAGSPRRGEWRIRVPVDRYASFLDAAETLAELQSRTEDSQEVTAEYYDVQVRIRNKQHEEERLLEHLEESTGKLEEILAVEKEISRVRTEVEQLQGRLHVLQDQTALSSVTLRVYELRGYVPEEGPTFGIRISRAWTQSIDGLVEAAQLLVLTAVACTPWLAVMAISVSGIVLLLRRLLKRRVKAAT